MRVMLNVLLLLLSIAVPAAAQRRIDAAPAGRYSLLGGDTVGAGTNVVSGEFGWPSVSFGYTHGLNRDTDIGLRFDLLFGVGFRVPMRMTALRKDRFSVLLHFDPGLKIFTTSPAMFGLAFPVGAV